MRHSINYIDKVALFPCKCIDDSIFKTTLKYYILWRELGHLASLIFVDIAITSIFVFPNNTKIIILVLIPLYL